MNRDLHHLLKRRRTAAGSKSSGTIATRAFDSLMLIVSVAAPLSLLPQVIQLFENKNAAGLSLITWVLLGSVNILWTIYGFIHKERPIIVANLLMGLLDFVVAFEIILYR
jgi:MtN3 and saliva related transmembrane protein